MRAYHVRIVLHHVSSEQSDSFKPISLWQPLPTHPYKSTARRNATFNPRGKDYRFGPIALDWVDLDNMSSSLFVSKGRADTKGAFTIYLQKVEAKKGAQDQQSLLSFLKTTPKLGPRIFRTGSSMFFAMPSNRNSPRQTRERPGRMPVASY